MSMDLSYSPEDEAFRAEVRTWLEHNLAGDFAGVRGLGGPGREHEAHDERLAWATAAISVVLFGVAAAFVRIFRP